LKNDLKLLKQLCEIPGVCGFEDPAQEIVEKQLKGCCDEVWSDPMGNVFGLKKAKSGITDPKKVMFAGHVDEIGLMVTFVDDNGFVFFAPVGGLSSQYLISQRVIIHGSEPVRGVIPTIYGGLVSDEAKNKLTPMENLYIDTGLSGKEAKAKINIGDIISIDQDFQMLNDKVVTARNFDDRLGVYSMIQAMKSLDETEADVYAVSTVQEELGVRGAHTAAYAVNPDFGIAIDGSITWDVPYAPAHQKHCSMGKGTGIYMMDRLTLGSPRLIKFLIDLCEKNSIAFQRNVGGGTDASAIQRSRGGALSTTIGAPTRYMHSSVQLAHVDDLAATSMLLKTFAENAHRLDRK
jgi:putative aminopeptidase FrvX